MASPPLACPSCSLRWTRTLFSPLNSFHKRCRGCCAGEALPSLNAWVTSAFPSCSRNTLLLLHLSGIQVGLILFHITKALYEDISRMLWKMTSGQWAVISCSNHLVQVVHASFVVVVVQDYGWLAILTITDLSCFVQCSSLGDKKLEWWWGTR